MSETWIGVLAVLAVAAIAYALMRKDKGEGPETQPPTVEDMDPQPDPLPEPQEPTAPISPPPQVVDEVKTEPISIPPVPSPVPPVFVQPTPEPEKGPELRKNWDTLLVEDWKELRIGGWIQFVPEYVARPADSYDDFGGSVRRAFGVPKNGWAAIGVSPLKVEDGWLLCDQKQFSGSGFAIIHDQVFDRTKELRVTTIIDLQPDEGAWVGLCFYNGEGNYREIGVTCQKGVLKAIMHTPQYIEVLNAINEGPHEFALIYLPEGGWVMQVDGVTVYEEVKGYRNNMLLANPSLGLWLVNLEVESRNMSEGMLRSKIGPVIVSQRSVTITR